MTIKSIFTLAAVSTLLTAGAAVLGREIRLPEPGTNAPVRQASDNEGPSRLQPAATSSRGISMTRAEDGEAPVFELPFFDNFVDGDATKANYTFLDLDGDGITYGESSVTNCWFWKADESLIQYCVDQNEPVPGNDWLMTPGIRLDGKTTYKLTIMINMGRASNLRVTVGKSVDPADHTTEILDLKNITCSGWFDIYSGEFTVDGEGIYYIGFYNYTSESGFYFNLFQINLEAGESTDIAEAPADFTAKADESGEHKAYLSFTAPARNLDGSQLPDDLPIEIKRDDKVISALTAAPGQEIQYTDESALPGAHTYSAYAVVDGKQGRVAASDIWIGQDLPSAPVMTKLVTVNGNMDVHLEWTAVTEGKNGYYFDPSSVTYTVYRGENRNAMIAIATGLTELEYTDTDLSWALGDRQEAYYYGVSAENSTGETLSMADILSVGKPYPLPAYDSFADGRLALDPWLTDPISGSFSWEVVTTSGSGMGAHDNDNGLLRFYDPYGGWDTTDSRLVSPVFTLAGTEHPILSFWMYHWQDASVAYESSTKMIPEIRVDNGEWIQLCDPLLAATPDWGWIEHKLALDEYKDAETVQFGFRGLTDVNWMYFFFDQIAIEDQPAHDLQLTAFYGAEEGSIDEALAYRIDYYNHGSETAEDYLIEIIADGEVVWSTYGDAIEPGKSGSVVATHSFNAAETGDHMLTARIVYDADANPDNNESSPVMVGVRRSFFPMVKDLTGYTDESGAAVLTWQAPFIPDPDATVTDGAEDYESWLITGIGDWITVDRDGQGSGYYLELPHKWPNCEANQAFIVWEPDQEMLDVIPSLAPYSGNKCFVSWLANVSDFWSDPVNDDWLISPEVVGGTTVKFMVKGIGSYDCDETYEVLVSRQGRGVDEFELLQSGVASSSWECVSVDLPEDAHYFAIRYTASFQNGLMIDDIEYTPITGLLELKGYEVFRNAVKISDGLVTDLTFTDTDAKKGSNYYSVSAVYDRGSSNACDPVNVITTGIGHNTVNDDMSVSVTGDKLTVTVAGIIDVKVYGTDGTVYFSGKVEGSRTIALQHGIYLVKGADNVIKVIL